MTSDVLQAARDYLGRGFSPIPIPHGQKGPIIRGWQNLRITEEELPRYFDGETHNIGILLGAASGSLVDVDLDCVEAERLAQNMLPVTDLITGRKSKAKSHYFYKSQGLKTKKFLDPEDGSMLVEVRSDGCQTIFPPSTHPIGENYEFHSEGEPAAVAAEELLQAVVELSALALLARHWPRKGSRQQAVLGLAGALLRGGADAGHVQSFVALICHAAGDSEAVKRVRAVANTADRLAAGKNTYGFTKLKEILGERVASRALDWLRVQPHPEPKPNDEQVNENNLGQRISAAVETLKALPDLLKDDVGAVFRGDVIGALALVREHNPAEWARAKAEMQQAKVSTRDVENAIRKAQGPKLRVVRPGEHVEEPRTAGELLGEDCPAPGLVIPPGFSLTPDATIQTITKIDPQTRAETYVAEVLAHAPVLITGRLRDIDIGAESLELTYRRPSGWRRQIVDRRVALDQQRLVELAGTGFPVASTNTKDLVRYLHELEAKNFVVIPVSSTTSHLGWQGKDGELGFLCGRNLVPPDGLIAAATGASGGTNLLVVFCPAASGDDQIAAGFHPAGTMEGWQEAVKMIQHYPRVLFGFYTAFVPPLQRILGAPNFIVDFACRTSTGKTTTLRVSASPWGNPNEQEENSLLWSWDSTFVFLERASAVLHSLPLFLDESQRAKDARTVANMLYVAAHGRGRGRGNTLSLSRTKTWHTVLISSGEMPATSFTQDGGTRARCIEIRGYPFGAANPATASIVSALNVKLKMNYGHAGPQFVQDIILCRHRWEQWKTDYQRSVAYFSGRLPRDVRVDPAVVDRLAHYMGAVYVAAPRVHEALALPWNFQDPLETVWSEIVADANEATGEERALRDVVSWAHANAGTFVGRTGSDENDQPLAPAHHCSGRWDSGRHWTFLAVFSVVLKKVLADLNYSPEGVLAGWKARGWLDVGPGRTYDKTVRMPFNQCPHMIVIRREAIDEIDQG